MAGLSTRERLDVEWTCAKLTHRFAQLLDGGDWDGVSDLFARDGALYRPSAPDEPVKGRAAIRAAYHARPAAKVTQHFITNTVVDVTSATEATGVCYILMYTATPGEGVLKADAVETLGRYHDRFVLEDGTWKFLERRGSVSMKTVG
ncbi:MAG TPA: nuclear transport factor 2 family protein [Caulobacteraceae bacterium]|nr:nuclear transport factor 2 family protein [Caulobacteraceae bacterium]